MQYTSKVFSVLQVCADRQCGRDGHKCHKLAPGGWPEDPATSAIFLSQLIKSRKSEVNDMKQGVHKTGS